MTLREIESLLSRNRSNGILLDTNLFLLYVAGFAGRRAVQELKALRSYEWSDFELLVRFAHRFKRKLTTPHILTEVSNLYRRDLHSQLQSAFAIAFKERIVASDEVQPAATTLCARDEFAKFGLTDCAISDVSPGACLVLTADFDLWAHLTKIGVDAVNFTHLRSISWGM